MRRLTAEIWHLEAARRFRILPASTALANITSEFRSVIVHPNYGNAIPGFAV
jgi:hypothetical protein